MTYAEPAEAAIRGLHACTRVAVVPGAAPAVLTEAGVRDAQTRASAATVTDAVPASVRDVYTIRGAPSNHIPVYQACRI